MSLEHADFYIGREFWTETGRWRCTDVGTRTICAISLESREIVTLRDDETQIRQIASDLSGLMGRRMPWRNLFSTKPISARCTPAKPRGTPILVNMPRARRKILPLLL